MRTTAILISRSRGVLTSEWVPEPNYKAGNAEFFDPDPACLIQLRPLLPADFATRGARRRGNALLYARNPPSLDIACYVLVPPHLRKNTRAGIMCAIGRAERFEPSIGARLREIAARTRWPKPPPAVLV